MEHNLKGKSGEERGTEVAERTGGARRGRERGGEARHTRPTNQL